MSRRGLLLGSILADAFSLGGHWIYDTDKLKQEFGRYDRLHDPLPESFHPNRKKGEHTHYGDQTLLLLEFLAENNNFKVDSFKRYWLEKMEHYDGYIDHATKESIAAIKGKNEWGSTSTDLSGASRIAPIIYCTPLVDLGIKDAIAQTKVTHNSEPVILSAELFARVAYKVLDKLTPSIAIEEAVKQMNNPWINKKLEAAKKHLELPPTEAIASLGQACSISGALPATLYLILKYEDDYRQAMIANVMAGGDSAARGLLVGMIIGGYKEETIPKEWLKDMCSLERVHF